MFCSFGQLELKQQRIYIFSKNRRNFSKPTEVGLQLIDFSLSNNLLIILLIIKLTLLKKSEISQSKYLP